MDAPQYVCLSGIFMGAFPPAFKRDFEILDTTCARGFLQVHFLENQKKRTRD